MTFDGNDEVERFVDRLKIHEVLSTYCRGVDRCDVDAVRSVYHEDSYDDHGYWKGRGKDFAAFVVDRLQRANSATTHSLSNMIVTFDDEGRARCETQVVATLVRRNTDPVVADVMGARYLDRLSKREGVWGIEERTVVLDWTKVETWPASDAPVPLTGFAWGKRDGTDPVFTLLERGTLQRD